MINVDQLRVGTPRHKSVLEALNARYDMSSNRMQDHHGVWEKVDKEFAFEVKETEADRRRRMQREGGQFTYTTIRVPYSYAMLMSAHTYLSTVFLSRDPVMQFQAENGEPQMNVFAVEALQNHQYNKGLQAPPLYRWLHDGMRYGYGVLGEAWDHEKHTVSEIVERERTVNGQPVVGSAEKIKQVRTIDGYVGNRVFNIRPYDALPDPRVPLGDLQRGEFFGYKEEWNWNALVRGKLENRYFNVEEVGKRIKGGSSSQDRYMSIVPEQETPDAQILGAQHTKTSLVQLLRGYRMVVEIIPREWQLGSTEHPEKWVFSVVDKQIIIEARPLGLLHNKFPFSVLETEIGAYSIRQRSLIEINDDLSNVMDFLVNSHFLAVRKSLNGDVVYDPARIEASDLLKSDGTGSRIRLRPSAYGTDVRTAIHHLAGGASVTGSHMQDAQTIAEMMQRVTGVTDNLMGVLNPGGRKTATEVRTASSSSINRLRTVAEYASSMAFAPMSQRLLATSQQLYTGERKLRIVGDTLNPKLAGQFINVTPEMIAGQYGYTAVDGTLPIDRFALVNMWSNLFAQIKNFPQIMQGYDVGEIFAWVAQLGGIKNIRQFKMEVVPDGGLSEGIPTNGATNAPRSAGGGASGAPVTPLPRQAPGMGQAG